MIYTVNQSVSLHIANILLEEQEFDPEEVEALAQSVKFGSVPETDEDGNTMWFRNGVWHREDGPAIEMANGSKAWYINGKKHRIDGPAVEASDGWREWWINGEPVRPFTESLVKKLVEEQEFDPDEVEDLAQGIKFGSQPETDSQGNIFWKWKGKLHREDGPAFEGVDGGKSWWIDDNLHREDGPAVEYANGHKQWWINGQPVRPFTTD